MHVNEEIEHFKRHLGTAFHKAIESLEGVNDHLQQDFDLKNNITALENIYDLEDVDDLSENLDDDLGLETPEKKDILENEIEKNLEIIHDFIENNKKFEHYLQSSGRSETEASSGAKAARFSDLRSSSGSLKNSPPISHLTKVRSEKSGDFLKASFYLAAKVRTLIWNKN